MKYQFLLLKILYGSNSSAQDNVVGSQLNYTQRCDFTGVKGKSFFLYYLNVNNDKFTTKQGDIHSVMAYAMGDFSLALKEIWVRHNKSALADGTINPQDKRLTQYRVIENYKF